MQQNRIRPLTEGGIMAAIAIIFAVISVYVPLVGPFVNLIWPVPIILLGVRQGYKWSIMATVVAGIIIAMLMHPLQAVSVVVGFGLIGIVLGIAFRQKFSPVKTLLLGSAASLVSKVAILAIGAFVLGVNPISSQTEVLSKTFEQAMDFYRQLGMKEQDLAHMGQTMTAALDLTKVILPAGFIMVSMLDTWLNFWLAKVVLKKLGYHIDGFPPFKQWDMPVYVAYAFGFALVMMYWGSTRELVWLYNTAMNIQVVAVMLLVVQGLALFYFLADKYKLSRLVRGIILFLIFSNGLLFVFVFAGIFDMAFDYRQLRTSGK